MLRIVLLCALVNAGCVVGIAESDFDRGQEIRVLLDEESVAMCREFELDYDTESAIVSFCFAKAFETSYNNAVVTRSDSFLPECEMLASECIKNPPDFVLEETDLGCDGTTTQEFKKECTATVGDVENCFSSMSDLFTDFVDGLDCSKVLDRMVVFENDTPECAAVEAKCPEFQ